MEKSRILEMLNIKNGSKEFYDLLQKAYQMSQEQYHGKGYVFAQIGLNAEPCSKNCKFCAFGKGHYSAEGQARKSKPDILIEAKYLANQGISDLFLMTTADYPVESFIDIAKDVKAEIGKDMKLVANIGDFDSGVAWQLKEAGITGVYHICRLNEGIDTDVTPEERIKTLDSIKGAGLELYYCIEPIGPEHTYDQMADEILRAIDYGVDAMAVMRRVPVKGTPLFGKGKIDVLEFTKIAAAVRIAVNPRRSMNAHETNYMTLLAGVNQLYAEVGSNPRDQELDTQKNRGRSVEECKSILADVGYRL